MAVLYDTNAPGRLLALDASISRLEDLILQWFTEREAGPDKPPTVQEFAAWASAHGHAEDPDQLIDLQDYMMELCDICFRPIGNEGYDGLCGDCADRRWNLREGDNVEDLPHDDVDEGDL